LTVTGVAQHRAWAHHELPPVEQVAGGLWSIPVPVPLAPLRYTLVYALEVPGALVLVDAGWDTEQAWQSLTNGLTQIGGSVTDVEAVLVTHLHPDHYGLAGRVREASDAWVGLHPADAALLFGTDPDVAGALAGVGDLLELAGMPASELGFLDLARGVADGLAGSPPDRLIEHGQRLPLQGWDLHAIHTPGHSPGHLCFHDRQRRVLMTGDHVLPRITPNIGVHALTSEDALAQFIDSLERVAALDEEIDEVLPAHEYRFSGLASRCRALISHHEQRLSHVRERLDSAMTAWELAHVLDWAQPWPEISTLMRPAAVAETLAHLVQLERTRRVRRGSGSPAHWFRI
jgi:glyoxylase-like metal-dependent hydrolase (beta-lactamase superfamily II)